jgi:hypothetical protein
MNGDEGRAASEEDRQKDRRRSIRLWTLSGLVTLALTSLTVVLL